MNTGRNLDVICGAILIYIYSGAAFSGFSASGVALEIAHQEIVQLAGLLLFGWFWMRHNQKYKAHEIRGPWLATVQTLSLKSLFRWTLTKNREISRGLDIGQTSGEGVLVRLTIQNNPMSRTQYFLLTFRTSLRLIWNQPTIADLVMPSAVAWVTLVALLAHNMWFDLSCVSEYWFNESPNYPQCLR